MTLRRKWRHNTLHSQRGSALLMALFTTMILMVIAMEIMYQTTVEAKVSSLGVNRLKAYYAAKSGVELGLFRVYLYRKAVAQVGDAMPDKSMLDMIWNFPFAWPPPVSDEFGMVTKDQIEKAVKNSRMQGTYSIQILSEGSKIDVNDLASPSKVVATATRQQILQMFQSRLENDEKFAEKFRNYDFNKLVNNMTDWIDDDTTSLNGGDERTSYRDINNEFIPPNQPFKTLGELHMVSEMTDELYQMIEPRLTVYGSKGINVNYVDKEVLMSLNAGITSEIADRILEGRNDPARGPFKDMDDFLGFVAGLGVRTEDFLDGKDPKIPLLFDAEYNFRVTGVGRSGKVTRQITAITYDVDTVKQRLGEFLKRQREKEKGATQDTAASTPPATTPPKDTDGDGKPDSPTQTSQKKKIEVPKARPNVVYWVES